MAKTLWKETLKVWLFGYVKIPMVGWLRPRVIELTDTRSVLMMPFARRTKNHVNSMYFGPLSVGAELAPGVLTLRLFSKQKARLTFVFKEFHAEFLKRCDGDAYFTFTEGDKLAAAIQQAIATGERQNVALSVIGTCPSVSGDEPIGRFGLTISMKKIK